MIAAIIIIALFIVLKSGAIAPRRGVEFIEPVEQWRRVVDAVKVPTIDTDLILAIIHVETRGDNNLVGQFGEIGLMQITPDAATDAGYYKVPTIASENIRCGSIYLALQIQRMESVRDGVRAYNAGESGARKGRGFEYLSLVESVYGRI